MPEYFRIKDPVSGDEYTYDEFKVALLGLEDAVVDKDPYGPDGRPALPKTRQPLGEPREGTRQAQKRATKKTSGAKGSGENAGQQSATPETEK